MKKFLSADRRRVKDTFILMSVMRRFLSVGKRPILMVRSAM